jgi:hypothetical protein
MNLIKPHGGRLVNRIVTREERERFCRRRAACLRSSPPREIATEMIATIRRSEGFGSWPITMLSWPCVYERVAWSRRSLRHHP